MEKMTEKEMKQALQSFRPALVDISAL